MSAVCPTDEELLLYPQLWRDRGLSKQDLYNLRRQQQQQRQWLLHDNPAESIDLWVEAHPEWVSAYQQQQQASEQIFVLGLQLEQQLQWLLDFGEVLITDSTFGTNNCMARLLVIYLSNAMAPSKQTSLGVWYRAASLAPFCVACLHAVLAVHHSGGRRAPARQARSLGLPGGGETILNIVIWLQAFLQMRSGAGLTGCQSKAVMLMLIGSQSTP
jgi:hypothetical protein